MKLNVAFAIERAHDLLRRKDLVTTKEAIQLLKETNDSLAAGNIHEAQLLYFLAAGYLYLKNIQTSYETVVKARLCAIEYRAQNQITPLEELVLYESEINRLLDFIKTYHREDINEYQGIKEDSRHTMIQPSFSDLKIAVIAEAIAGKIEKAFNTKVYKYGVANKSQDDFEKFGFNLFPPAGTELLFWFLVPIDDADNVITNDYFEKSQMLNKAFPGSMQGRYAASEFQSILRQDWDLSNFLQQQVGTQVYDTGALRVQKYNSGDNIVPHAAAIDDLRYRFFRFFSPKLS